MYRPVLDPAGGSLALSALFAMLPLLTLFILLGVLRMSAWKAALFSLLVALLVAVIATGVPKPASASSSAPKQNAMITAWIRWSSLTRANDRRRTSKCPVTTVML